MKGGDLDALTGLERTLLRKKLAVSGLRDSQHFPHLASPHNAALSQAHERLRQTPDTLAAVIIGCMKAVARASQRRWVPCP
jgi:hypothetical protein